jgi:hypothetical protein
VLPILLLMDWAAGEVVTVVYTPVVHYHTLEGPSTKTHILSGPVITPHALEGPSQKTHTLTGSH